MRRIRYTLLASVQVTHSFYADNRCPDFALIPTKATADLLTTFDWVIRQDNQQLLLMGREDEPGTPTSPIDAPTVLTFVMLLKNPHLPNVSNWGAKGPFYFTNLNLANGKPKPADAGTGETQLPTGPTVSETDLLPPIKKQHLSFSFEKTNFKSLIISRFMPGSGLKQIDEKPIEKPWESLEITLPTPGRYTLTWEKTDGTASVVEPIFASDDLANRPLFFGLVELCFDRTPAVPTRFVIPMQHRAQVWRYVLIDSKGKLGPPDVDTIADLGITYQNPGAPFPAAVTFAPVDPPGPDDQALIDTIKTDSRVQGVYIFESAEALPILDYKTPKLRLTFPGGSSMLPVPTPETNNSTLFFTI